jgi:hypothetical protein
MSNSLPIDSDVVNLKSNFQRTRVAYDIDRTFCKDTSWLSDDYLIIDFIDERFGIVEYLTERNGTERNGTERNE